MKYSYSIWGKIIDIDANHTPAFQNLDAYDALSLALGVQAGKKLTFKTKLKDVTLNSAFMVKRSLSNGKLR